MKYHLWVWNEPWVVLATYPSREAALKAGRRSGDPSDTWTACRQGSPLDEHMRTNCADRMALSRWRDGLPDEAGGA